ncbi:MAG: hypothetical protein IPN17_11520 [Deltaproteobacteria bacterium]|nr:hypothetical protein [Deltaproteobacteria bacterium]MBK8692895.1 hypothetical protein [Deltaproteobacteria bacterium]MBP6831416.1 hypothetical protein [Deltaproteobacteria bacterium]
MSEVIKVFAAYGPSQALSLALWPDGSFLFHLQGNVPPLFAAVEMGSWRGVDGARGPALFADIARALPRTVSNASTRPDSAYMDVKREVDGAAVEQRTVNLYEPPAHWDVAQARLLGLVQGPWLAHRERTVTAEARWDSVAAASRQPVLEVTFAATGREPASIPSPASAEGWSVSLLPAGATAEEQEDFPSDVQPDEFILLPARPSVGAWLELRPGDRYELRLEVNRQLPPGSWDVTASWLAADPGWGRHPANRLSGRLTLDPGPITVPGAR